MPDNAALRWGRAAPKRRCPTASHLPPEGNASRSAGGWSLTGAPAEAFAWGSLGNAENRPRAMRVVSDAHTSERV